MNDSMMHPMRPVWRLICTLDKSGRVHVVGSVPLLHPEAQTVDEMLEGWRNQQMCRNLGHDTIAGRIRLVERFVEPTASSHTTQYGQIEY